MKLKSIFLLLLCFPLRLSAQTVVSGPCGDSWAYNGNTNISSNAVTFPSSSGSAFDTTKVDLTQPFDMNFQLMAEIDGLAFVIQTEGLNAIGGNGAGQGFGNTKSGGLPASSPCIAPSVDIEVDTYDNYGSDCNDPPEDHVGFRENGVEDAAYVVGPIGALVSNATIVDGNLHTFEVKWVPSSFTMTVYFDGVLRLTYVKDIVTNIFGGTNLVYWGWTGASSAPQYVIIGCGPTPTPQPTGTPTVTFTPTYTGTPTNTPTNTMTNTPTITSTPTNTATITPTSTYTFTCTATVTSTPTCVVNVWPDPYNPKSAYGGSLKISCMNEQSTVSIYTISGELIQTLGQNDSCQIGNMWGTSYCWNGRNKKGMQVTTGIYLYVVEQNNKVTNSGKFLMIDGG